MPHFIQHINRHTLAPVLVVAVALLLSIALVSYKPAIEKNIPAKVLPTVPVQTIALQSTKLSVKTQGLVKPHKQIELASEIAGRVTWVSETLIAGGKFGQYDPLIRIDATDYELRLQQASAANVRSEVDLEIADKNYRRQQNLYKQKLISPTKLDDAYQQFKLAEASAAMAKADLEQAGLNLRRTEVLAPFSGRVQKESIDEGGYVSAGSPIATLYADEIVEVRLPIANEDLNYLNWPQQMRGTLSPEQSVKVKISSAYGGVAYSWEGELQRVESEVDTATRLFYGVAVVANPELEDKPPLTVGLYVQAEIAGRSLDNVAIIPRTALLNTNNKPHVLLLDDDNRLYYQPIDVIRIDKEQVIVGAGLKPGDLLCVSPPSIIVSGMQVKPSSINSAAADTKPRAISAVGVLD